MKKITGKIIYCSAIQNHSYRFNKAKKLIEMIGGGNVLRLRWKPAMKRWGVDRIDDWKVLSQLTKEAGVPTNYLTYPDYDKVLQVAGNYDITIETVGAPEED